MKEQLEQLKKEYEDKMQSLFDTEQDTDLQVLRAAVKISCYRSFIVEIDRILSSESDKDAKLIAAASELLIGCIESLKILESVNHPQIDWVTGHLRKVIKEATEGNNIKGKVTHWMPLPEPPKE